MSADKGRQLSESEVRERYGIDVSDSAGAETPDVAEPVEVDHGQG